MAQLTEEAVKCYHCGQHCLEEVHWQSEKSFCCTGCKTVYEILQENDLCQYYTIDEKPGQTIRPVADDAYSYLDDPTIRKKLLQFDSPTFGRVTLALPTIHCSSCIWLLENLKRLVSGVLKSEVSFTKKSITIDFDPRQVSLGRLAHTIASIGYPPQLSLDDQTPISNSNNQLVIQLAVAGFCFGNIMLFSFPEYLGLPAEEHGFQKIFSWLNLALAVPVLMYSSRDYFINAWHSFKQKQINIDVPIAVGLLALFLRSSYDIISTTGPGYLDSFAGLVFFLLIGRWFQNKTYQGLAFDRDYKSYFPLAVYCWSTDQWKPILVYQIKKADRLRIRNMEVIPADVILLSVDAFIDYSFVTGEAKPVFIKRGEWIYAGGRLIGQPIEVEVMKETSQSYLTGLWNNNSFRKPMESRYKKIIDHAATNFTWVVMFLAFATGIAWYFYDPSKMWLVLTSVLMVACPCALALVAPFTYGGMMRVFGRHGFYLKNADIIERMATINSVVLDKTGTVTSGSDHLTFIGDLNDDDCKAIYSITSGSTHPLSSIISKSLAIGSLLPVHEFREHPGKGIEGIISDKKYKIGSADYVEFKELFNDLSTRVFVSVDNHIKGYFRVEADLREDIQPMLQRLGKKVKALLSGDNNSDEARMRKLFGSDVVLRFNQTPQDKLDFICNEQWNGHQVMMIGDGLNDSGALKQSDVGIAVSDDAGVFSPACDGILTGNRLRNLDRFLLLSKKATTILKSGFLLSFFYNLIALSIAMMGYLTPLVAAILMPISSISVVVYSTVAVNLAAKRHHLSIKNS